MCTPCSGRKSILDSLVHLLSILSYQMQSDSSSMEATSLSTPSIAATSVVLPPPYSVDPITADKMKIAGLLNVPTHLVGSGKDAPLHLAYEKYCAFLAASQSYDKMVVAGTWMMKKLMKADLMELVISKSFYFSHYCPCFSKLSEYPNMVAWLKNRDETDDLEVWGI